MKINTGNPENKHRPVAHALAWGALLLLLTMWQLPAQPTKAQAAKTAAQKPNVLFIVADGLNHWVKHLGRNKQVITPNIDRLAARGVTFANAYCAAPVCNPSRAALMSGMRPSTTGVYNNNVDWRPLIAPEKTLVTQFRQHGYYTAGAGKIYHGGFDRKEEWDDYQREAGDEERCKPLNANNGVGGIRFTPLDCRDEDMVDYQITTYGVEQLQRQHDQPFFLTIGVHKPHLPFSVPKKYFDLYPLDQIELPPYKEDDLDDIPPAGVRMATWQGDHAAILKSGRWKEAIQAYLAAISFTDMNVGRLLDALDRSAYRDNTIIVFWGDHGWSLGEKHHWRKFALWEEPTRAPFIWVAPGVTKAGGVSRRTVDFMSVYPTLAELCGLPLPKHVEGVSIRKLLVDPNAKWDRPALTTHEYNNHAVRSARYRYIRYNGGGEELYNETNDPYEWKNLAGETRFAPVKRELAKWLPKTNAPEGPNARSNENDEEQPGGKRSKQKKQTKP